MALLVQGSRSANGCERIIYGRLLRDPRDPGCTLSYVFELRGAYDPARLERALRTTVVSRFPELLCRFETREDAVVRRDSAPPASFLRVVRDVDTPSADDEDEVLTPDGRLFEFALQILSPTLARLRLRFSHLAFDGECYHPFMRRFREAYSTGETAASNVSTAIPSVDAALDEPFDTDDVAFWRQRLVGRRLGQNLGFLAGGRASARRFACARRTVSGDDYAVLRRFLENERTTLFRLLTAALAVVVFRYDPEEHVDGLAIGHTVGLRTAPDASGCFANVLPLFVPDRPDWTPRDYLDHVAAERRAIRPHQCLPLPDLVALADERVNRNLPMLNVVVNESQGLLPVDSFALGDAGCSLIGTPSTGGPYDLGLTFAHDETSLRLSIDVPAALATRPLVAGLADALLAVLARFVAEPDAPVSAVDLSRPLTAVASGAFILLPGDDALPARMLDRARTRPDAVAIRFGDAHLTYAEMAADVAGLVARIEAVADPSALDAGIGIAVGRSERLPIAMLAALVLGVPFVPLERSLPPERLAHVLDTTGLTVAICDADGACELRERRPGLVLIDIAEVARGAGIPSLRPVRSDLAYLLFTSGSTGLPKGVGISRRNLLNFMLSMVDMPGFDVGDRFLALTPISFDISILELFLPLFVGGEMHIVDDETRRSAVDLGLAIERSGVDIVQATPATWRMLKAVDWRSRRRLTLLCGGEALTREIADDLLEQGHRLFNMYGPTEATIWASCVEVHADAPIHLGVPVANTRFHVVDERLRSVADGQPGELLIEGECVGAGYLRRDSAAFLDLGDGRRGYRTGDIVRALGDGRVVYVGRRDNQRKINGYRIELDEISLRIRALLGDADVFTVVRDHPVPHLCAFYLPHDGERVDASRILDAARRALPAYMVPSALVPLETLPLTPNGKVDLKHLAQCPLPAIAEDPASPALPSIGPASVGDPCGTLGDLFALASKALGIALDDPHASLGWLGLNSISYNILAQAIGEAFGVRIPPHRFYALNTLAEIASEVDRLLGREVGSGSASVAVREKASRIGAAPRASDAGDGAIAVVGQSVLMPGGLESDAFWDALMRRADLVVPRTRSGFRAEIHAGFLDDIEGFDAKFFSISPLEANHMDPRQRLLLQTAWRAVEDAGYAAAALAGRDVGCYIAATGADYATLQARADNAFTPYSLPGSSLSILANRISSFFDWSGPSTAIDTACSGSLSAIVKACRDLAAGVCEAALVGGVNVIADDQISRGLEVGNFMSPRYRCATFDAEADGYVRGEGVACFLLKRLADAVADGDPIHGVVVGYGENHGGRSTSLTAPNPEAQTRLLTDVYSPELAARVGYIETHGTGTRLGDPIEIDALKAAWERLGCPSDGRRVWLGAVKSNIGHLEPAAGVASLAKVLSAMRHGVLPPNIHFERLNPLIALDGSPFSVLDAAVDWPDDVPRTAGISSFGFGGSNAHIVVSEPPARALRTGGPSHVLIALSARSEAAFGALRSDLRRHVADLIAHDAAVDLESLAFTLNAGRTHFEFRAAWVVGSLRELEVALSEEGAPAKVAARSAGAPVGAVAGETRLDQLDRVRTAYLQGSEIVWREIHREGTPRMHLPTYRFDSQRYWFDRGRTAPSTRTERRISEEALP